MEDQVERLANKAWTKFQSLDASKRYLIALAGIPGSGKTTTAASIVQHINQHHHHTLHQKNLSSSIHRTASQPDIAMVVPMDGFHLTRAQLSALPNPEEAHYRRGAAFTFDPAAYLVLVTQLRRPLEAGTRTVFAPSFSHHIKDPVAHDIPIPPTARIILFEGLYTALNRDIWRDAAAQMDEIWRIDTPIPLATERIAKRNFAAGLSESYEAAVERTEASDMRNGREILAEMVEVDETIHSVEDEEWKREVPSGMVASGSHSRSGSVESGVDIDADDDDDDDNDQEGESDEGEGNRRPRIKPRMDSIAVLAASGGGC